MGIHAEFIGSGVMFAKDTAGNSYEAGLLQDITLDWTSEFKELQGDAMVATLVAEVGRKYSLSAKWAQYSSALRDSIEGATVAAGSKRIGKVRKTAAASAFTVATADFGSPAGWAFVADLGVKYASNGQPLKYNSGTLASTGEYKNTAAAYTLGAGDATAQVDVTCVFSVTAGETATIVNPSIGLSKYFAIHTYRETTQADGRIAQIYHHFLAGLFTGNKGGGNNSEWSEENAEIRLFPDASGNIGYRSTLIR